MPNDPAPDDPRNLWQNQDVEKVTITLIDLQRRAARWERRIYWRNLREYAAGVVVIAFLVVQLWRDHGWRLAPPLLGIAGSIYVVFQLRRRGAARSLPADADLKASLDFHVHELERQRDALQTVWKWYLLPFVPFFLASMVVGAVDRGLNARLMITGIFLVFVLVGVWGLNRWAARKIASRVQELREMEVKD